MDNQNFYNEISDMQDGWNKSWRDKRRWIIVDEEDGTFSIHEHMKDGVAPPCVKTNKRELAARFLQCFGVGPVAPQDHPEEICVGVIEKKSADIIPIQGDKK